MLKFIIYELSVGNWVQNLAFYIFLILLSYVVIIQIKSTSKVQLKKRRALK
jgi:hypothetical protein